MHLVAASYGRRPSEIVGMDDERLAYDFDLSVIVIALGEDKPKSDDPNQYADISTAYAARRR